MARPRLITDEQILEMTRACVLEKGAQVSLDVVAGELGVTGPALLKRFGSRQELWLRALRPPENPVFIEHFLAGPDERPFSVQLEERFTEMWHFFEEVVPCISALRESGIPHDKLFDGRWKNPLRALQAITRWLEMAHEQGLAHVPAAASVATAILGAIQTRAFTGHIAKVKYSPRSTTGYLRDIVDLFSRALALEGRPASRKLRVVPSDS
jgi:AcrR family transcriptional regulator